MRSRLAPGFRKLLRDLPPDIRRQAGKAYEKFKDDPYHPSLHFKRVSHSEPLYSVRINERYRALGLRKEDDSIIWVWIGPHDEYDKRTG